MASLTGLLRMILGSAKVKERIIGVLGAFLDDSGTHSASRVVAIGGLLGTDVQWDAFAPAWDALLANPLPGKPPLKKGFHLTQCRSGNGEFRDYSRAERDHVTYLFRRIILDIGLVSVAAAVNKVAWDKLVAGPVADELGSPLKLCFFKCLELVINFCRRDKPGQKVCLCFDEGTRPELGDFAEFCNSHPDKYPELEMIFFAPVSKIVALQGGDMIALETYQYGEQWFEHGKDSIVNPHFRDFIARELSCGLAFDHDQISEMVDRARTAMISRGLSV